MKNKKNTLWLIILIVIIIGAIFLMQRTFLDNNQTKDEPQQTNQKSSQTSTNKSTSQSDATTSLSGDKELTLDSTMRGSSSESSSDTSETGIDVQSARIKLYQAGIDSSAIDDATIIQYWQQAQAKQIDFPEYVKSQMQ